MTDLEKRKKAMKALGMTDEEITQTIEDDKIIDKGGRCEWEPSAEEEKAQRKATKVVGSKPKKPREPKAKVLDEDKYKILSYVKIALDGLELKGDISDLEMKGDTEINYNYNGNAYTLKLTKHRPPKN